METITLNNGVEIPQTELGVFQTTDPTICKQSVMSALSVGYRLFDTAACNGNEQAVGETLFESGISRNEFFSNKKNCAA